MRTRILSTTFLAIAACLLWSTAFVGVKIGLQYTTPLQFAGIRFFLAGLYILPFCGNISRSLRLISANWKTVLRLGFFQTFVLYALFYIGISMVPAGLTAIIIGAAPLFTAIMAHLLLSDDRISLQKIASILLGITGVVIIALSRGNYSWAEGKEFWGVIILVISNISGSLGNVVFVKYKSGLSPLLLTSSQFLTGGAGLFLLSVFVEGLDPGINELSYYLSLGWLSFLSAAAFSIWFTLLKRPGVKVSELNVWKFLIPVFGAMLSWIILPDESPELIAIVGMIFIALSLLVLHFSQVRQHRRAAADHENKRIQQ